MPDTQKCLGQALIREDEVVKMVRSQTAPTFASQCIGMLPTPRYVKLAREYSPS